MSKRWGRPKPEAIEENSTHAGNAGGKSVVLAVWEEGMKEDKIRGHHHWAQINVNLADIFNGVSLPRSVFLPLTATEE